MVYNDKEKANLLNEYFCSISSVDDTDLNTPSVTPRTNSFLSDFIITEQDIKDTLKSLKIGNACCNDIISHQMLKGTADYVYKPLLILFNYSLKSGTFSTQWKLARVVASFQKDDKSKPSNYRPISLLSCVGKVMEWVVYKHIYNYILEHSLLYAYQSGFLKGHSTVYQLLEIYHNACQYLNKELSSIIISCNLSKAFDRVWHIGFMLKLRSYGIFGKVLNWVKDYISNRQQVVFINNETSNYGDIKAGIPQGSDLEPYY